MTDTERLRAALVRIREVAARSSRTDAPATLHMIMAFVDAALDPTPTPDTRPGLTPPQARILEFIKTYLAANGYPPTYREIGARFEIASPNGVMCHVKALERKGYIQFHPHKSRTLAVVEVGA